MAEIVALVTDEDFRSRLRRAIPHGATLRFCERCAELQREVTSSGAGVIVTQLADVAGDPVEPVLEMLHEHFPDLPVLVAAVRPPLDPGELLNLGRLGVSSFLSPADPDLGERLGEAIRSREERTPVSAIVRTAAERVPAALLPCFERLAAAATSPRPVAELLRDARIAPRTLRDRLQRAGLPPPARIQGWCRLLHAMWRLEHSGRPVKAVASELGYPDGMSLRGHLKRHTGLRISQVPRHAAFDFLLARFGEELERRRPASQSSSPRR